MTFFTSSELSQRASTPLFNRKSIYESANTVLAKEAKAYDSRNTYDIFLSHSILDANVIYGLKSVLEDNGFSVYIYWIEDAAERSTVSPEIAERIKHRMQSSKALLYATSENAQNSKWMPWELGYFDGLRGKVAVCPISSNPSFVGREYLGLYPVMEKDLWLWKDGKPYKRLKTMVDET